MLSRRSLRIGLLIVGVAGVGFLLLGPRVHANVWEEITGETPQAKIAAYVRAVARGDEEGAVVVWELPPHELTEGRSAKLAERRQAVTRELMHLGISPDFTVVDIEWWQECCVTRVIDDPRDAGVARVTVLLHANSAQGRTYVFDVFTRDRPYPGAAAGYPPRRWMVHDIYPIEREPIYWPTEQRSATW